MIRTLAVLAIVAGSGVAASLSHAQSPDPARLAPGSSRSVHRTATFRRHALRGHSSEVENGGPAISWKEISPGAARVAVEFARPVGVGPLQRKARQSC
jgi:hypothetical protein